MKIDGLNKSVIFIDCEFLNAVIRECFQFYKKTYPDKFFEKIPLNKLIYEFARNARINDPQGIIDVIFVYPFQRNRLVLCTPADLLYELNNTKFGSNIGRFEIRTYFSDEFEIYDQFANQVLQEITSYPIVENIAIVGDRDIFNEEISRIHNWKTHNLFLLKLPKDSRIQVPVFYANIFVPIALGMGLNLKELK